MDLSTALRRVGMQRWIVRNFLVTSFVLTLLVNGALRLWPAILQRFSGEPDAETLAGERTRGRSTDRVHSGQWGKVFFPWKTMVVASIALTIVLNVGLRLL